MTNVPAHMVASSKAHEHSWKDDDTANDMFADASGISDKSVLDELLTAGIRLEMLAAVSVVRLNMSPTLS